MLGKTALDIFDQSRAAGWVLEPDAKMILKEAGLPIPSFKWVRDQDKLKNISALLGFPLVAKVVSPSVIHKSEVQGVETGIQNLTELNNFYKRTSTIPKFNGIIVEQMGQGLELIIGAKNDCQFGPVVVLGIGGTGVEIYKDVAMRMAPLTDKDADDMLQNLQGRELLSGFRGSEEINREGLIDLVLKFSNFVMEMPDYIESIDLNPVLCSAAGCLIVDARIMLSKPHKTTQVD